MQKETFLRNAENLWGWGMHREDITRRGAYTERCSGLGFLRKVSWVHGEGFINEGCIEVSPVNLSQKCSAMYRIWIR